MKSKYLLFPVLGVLASAALTGCYDMDTLPLSQNITEEQKVAAKEANPDMAQASITGITSLFSTYMNVVSTASAEIHSDFGFPSVMLGMDSRGIDLVSEDIGYNWFTDQAKLNDCTVTGYGTRIAWGNCYNQIFAANAAIKSISADTEDPTLQFYLAQGKAIRAFDYFVLAQIYQFTYKGNESAPCVMLVTDLNEDEVAMNGCGRSTVEETYTQIVTDLDDAIALLESSGLSPEDVLSSQPKRFLSLAAVYGLRARVNLVKNEWDAAAADAEKAITLFKGAPRSLANAAGPGFTSLDESDWMWGIAIAPTDRVVTSGIVNWISHMGSLNYGYASVGAWRCINKALYDYIPETDVRKTWFLDGDGKSAGLSAAQQAYLDGNASPYTQVKFDSYQSVVYQDENANDIPLMRVEEMYYILAEASAMGSAGPAAGAQVLNQFVKTYRDPAYSFAGGSAEDVQNECWMQRRVELWGEGLTTFDLLRLKKPFDRRGGGWKSTLCYNVAPTDPVLIYCIPQTEINGNYGFNAADNNDPQPQPTPVADYDAE